MTAIKLCGSCGKNEVRGHYRYCMDCLNAMREKMMHCADCGAELPPPNEKYVIAQFTHSRVQRCANCDTAYRKAKMMGASDARSKTKPAKKLITYECKRCGETHKSRSSRQMLCEMCRVELAEEYKHCADCGKAMKTIGQDRIFEIWRAGGGRRCTSCANRAAYFGHTVMRTTSPRTIRLKRESADVSSFATLQAEYGVSYGKISQLAEVYGTGDTLRAELEKLKHVDAPKSAAWWAK